MGHPHGSSPGAWCRRCTTTRTGSVLGEFSRTLRGHPPRSRHARLWMRRSASDAFLLRSLPVIFPPLKNVLPLSHIRLPFRGDAVSRLSVIFPCRGGTTQVQVHSGTDVQQASDSAACKPEEAVRDSSALELLKPEVCSRNEKGGV